MLSIILTCCGLWALVTGKVPSALVGKKHRIEGVGARVIGAILLLPMPLGFVSGLVLGALMSDDGLGYATAIELLAFVLTLVAVLIISRVVRKPIVAA
jgi:hypothetical protein